MVCLSLNFEQNDKPEQPISHVSSVSSRHLLRALSDPEARQPVSSCCQADQSFWKARQQRLSQVRLEARAQQASLPTFKGRRWGLAGDDLRKQLQSGEWGRIGLQVSSRASRMSWMEGAVCSARRQVSRQLGFGAFSQQCRSVVSTSIFFKGFHGFYL